MKHTARAYGSPTENISPYFLSNKITGLYSYVVAKLSSEMAWINFWVWKIRQLLAKSEWQNYSIENTVLFRFGIFFMCFYFLYNHVSNSSAHFPR